MNKQMNQMPTLEGKRIILLGGSGGFGLATAKAAAAEGAKVVIVSGNAQRVQQALEQLPQGAEGQAVDLSREENIHAFFEQNGSFDHLVYTAAEPLSLSNIGEQSIDKAREFFNLRYWGAFAAVKYGAPHINTGGSINLTSGTAGMRPGKGWSLASSICGAMEGFVRALAVELAPIRVNCVVPALIRTGLWSGMMNAAEQENFFKTVGDTYPVKRVGEAEDVALAFLYLMKQQFATGHSLLVDGGAVLV
jgi:NAD(P)-dependent dehydrogenase (short-subunit alcohol dehydrogenase family)